MAIMTWLKRPRLDEGNLQEFGSLMPATHAPRASWTPSWLEAVGDFAGDVRYGCVRSRGTPRSRSSWSGAVSSHWALASTSRVLHHSQELRALSLAGVQPVRHGSVSSSAKRARDGSFAVSYPDFQFLRDHHASFRRALRQAPWWSIWPRARGPAGVGRAGHRQLLFAGLVSAPSSGARSASDDVAPLQHPGGRDQPRALAPRLQRRSRHRRQDHRAQQRPAHGRRRHRSVVPRHGGELRHRSLHPDHDGAADRRRNTVAPPADPLRDRYTAMVSPHGYLRPGTSMAQCARRARGDVGHAVARSHARRGRSTAARRAVLAVADRRPEVHAADADGVERHGPAGADDRLRQHRGARPGTRRFTAR